MARLADDAFHVRSGQPELLWVKQAWEVLAKAGFTAYRSKVEHHQVRLRLLALSGIYSESCEVAFDETSESKYSYLFELPMTGRARSPNAAGPPFELPVVPGSITPSNRAIRR